MVILAIALVFEDSIVGFEEDLIALFGFLSPGAERVLYGAVVVFQLLVVAGLLAFPLFTGRHRLVGYIALASVVALALMALVDGVVERQVSSALDNRLAERAGLSDSGTTAVMSAAQMAAMFVVAAPFVGRRWRRAGAIAMTAVVLIRLLVATTLPADLFVALPLGAACAAAVLLLFGRPDRRPTESAIEAGLTEAGLPVTRLWAASVDAKGSTPYFATLDDGSGLFVKVLGADERAADLLFRAYRFLRLKNVGDDRLFSSLRRTVEHEALVSLMARNVAVRTPRLRSVIAVGSESMLLAFDRIDGRWLTDFTSDELDDALLHDLWSQIGRLRQQGIAHRDLRGANIVIGDGEAWVIDFGFSEVAVPDEILDNDVAQLLASLSLETGAERSVSTAVDQLGPETVGASLPRLQLRGLAHTTQKSLEEHPGRLDELQQQVKDQCGVDEVELAELERFDTQSMITIGALVLATYFLIPQFADLPGIAEQVRDATWAWTPLLLAAASLTYVAATMAFAGTVATRLPLGPLFATQVGSSFTSTLAPASVGGMALNTRFLQKQGLDRAVAVSGVGLNTVAGLLGHLALLVLFLGWAGDNTFGSIHLPDPHWFIVGASVTVVLVLVGLTIPWLRSLLVDKVLPSMRRGLDAIWSTARRPGKLALLLGGSVLITFGNLLTLYFSVEAFGGGLPFATVGAAFLVGSAVASAAPTPGGLGAMEAALIGGLVAAGLDPAVALPAVFLFRLFTFWLPILPGWFAFTWLQRHDYV